MTRIDWVVLRRIAGRVALTVTIFYGLLALAESLDTWRMQTLNRIGGIGLSALAIAIGAGRSSVMVLPITLLLGTIIGVLDMQTRREMTIIRSAGISIWRTIRAPVIAAALLGVVASFVVSPALISVDRQIPARPTGPRTASLWLEQTGSSGDYILFAEHPHPDGIVLEGVTLFFTSGDHDRVVAEKAQLVSGAWELSKAVRYRPNVPPSPSASERVATRTTAGDMQVRLSSAKDLTFSELVAAVTERVTDPALRASALTSLFQLVASPGILVGSVLIGFAFTSGYRRTNKYGGAVLYGIVLGFVVYVVTELATRAGFAGVLDPAFAAAGPAFVAIVIGTTVLLYKEDGRA